MISMYGKIMSSSCLNFLTELFGTVVCITAIVCFNKLYVESIETDGFVLNWEFGLFLSLNLTFVLVLCITYSLLKSQRHMMKNLFKIQILQGNLERVQFKSSVVNGDPCPICLEEYGDFRFKTKCNHTFCPHCIETCVKGHHSNCPLCRTSLVH